MIGAGSQHGHELHHGQRLHADCLRSSPIFFAGGKKDIKGIGGLKFEGDGGGLVQYSDGKLSIGGYLGGEKKLRAFGGGGYITLGTNCN